MLQPFWHEALAEGTCRTLLLKVSVALTSVFKVEVFRDRALAVGYRAEVIVMIIDRLQNLGSYMNRRNDEVC